MHNLSQTRKLIKDSLSLLDSSIFSKQLCLGAIIAPVLFKKGKRALLIDVDERKAFVFSNNQKEADYSIMLLTEFIALMKDMKQKGLVLEVDKKKTEIELLYSNPYNELVPGSLSGRYYTSDDCELVLCPNPQLNDGEIVLTGFSLPSQLYNPLQEILLAVFFPTPDYFDYLKHGFCLPETYRTKSALRVSWIAVVVAFLIGVLTPLCSVLLGNRFGHTTIEEQQFQELKQILRGDD